MGKELDYTVTYPELQQYSDYDLADLMMCAERDRKDNYWAKCVYWMCVLEISNREDIDIEYMNVKCIANLFDSKKNYIFKKDDIYQLYAIDNVALVFDDELHPYVFMVNEADNYCVNKFFGMLDY